MGNNYSKRTNAILILLMLRREKGPNGELKVRILITEEKRSGPNKFGTPGGEWKPVDGYRDYDVNGRNIKKKDLRAAMLREFFEECGVEKKNLYSHTNELRKFSYNSTNVYVRVVKLGSESYFYNIQQKFRPGIEIQSLRWMSVDNFLKEIFRQNNPKKKYRSCFVEMCEFIGEFEIRRFLQGLTLRSFC